MVVEKRNIKRNKIQRNIGKNKAGKTRTPKKRSNNQKSKVSKMTGITDYNTPYMKKIAFAAILFILIGLGLAVWTYMKLIGEI